MIGAEELTRHPVPEMAVWAISVESRQIGGTAILERVKLGKLRGGDESSDEQNFVDLVAGCALWASVG